MPDFTAPYIIPGNLLNLQDPNQNPTQIPTPPMYPSYAPSWGRRLAAAVAGGAAGFSSRNPVAGVQVAENIKDQPYREAYQDWLSRLQGLQLGSSMDIARENASNRGLSSLASILRARFAMDPAGQGAVATAKENAKKTPEERDYEYWNNLDTNQKEDFENMLLKKKNGIERVSGQMISADDAKYLADTLHKVFKDRQGNTIDPKQLQSQMGLSLISGGTPGDSRYEIVTQPTRNVTQDNVTRVIPSRTPQTPITEGVARPPVFREAQAVDAQGNPVTQELQTRVQTGPGQVPQPSQPQVQPPNNQVPQVQPQNPPLQPQAPPVQQNQNQPPQIPNTGGRRGNIQLGAFTPAEMRRQTKYVAPANAAFSQIFGDPDKKTEGLVDFADLMDLPEGEKTKIAKAIRLSLNGLEKMSTGERLGANAAGYGASIETGGLLQYLKNISGLTAKETEAQANVISDAMKDLNPRERRYVAKLFASYGDLQGFRSLVNSSGYEWAFNNFRREIPAPGMNEGGNDSKTYYNKLGSFSNAMLEGLKGSGVSDRLLQNKNFWNQKTAEISRYGLGETAPQRKPRVIIEEVQ